MNTETEGPDRLGDNGYLDYRVSVDHDKVGWRCLYMLDLETGKTSRTIEREDTWQEGDWQEWDMAVPTPVLREFSEARWKFDLAVKDERARMGLPELKFADPAQADTIQFQHLGETVGILRFREDGLTFEGKADDSALIFMANMGRYMKTTALKQLHEARELMSQAADVIEDVDGDVGDFDRASAIVDLRDMAAAIGDPLSHGQGDQ